MFISASVGESAALIKLNTVTLVHVFHNDKLSIKINKIFYV